MLALLGRMRTGRLAIVEGRQRWEPGGDGPVAGWWDSPDLRAVLDLAARDVARLDELRGRLTPVREPFQRGRAPLTRTTPDRARRGIAAHYDLGNELFSALLDLTLMYRRRISDVQVVPAKPAWSATVERPG